MKQHMMVIGWPSFLMAGVIEMLVFAMVDPESLHWMGGAGIELSRSTIYSLAFFAFWLITAIAAAMALYLATPEPEAPTRTAARYI